MGKFLVTVVCPALVALLFAAVPHAQADDGTVKVFLMAGQSNMQGHGEVEVGNGGVLGAVGSLRYQVNNDPANYGHLGDGAGTWYARPDVWVWNRQGSVLQPTNDWTTTGDLTAGFGAYSDTIGPELGFGTVIGNHFDEQVVLVKTAWGGASLAVDFISPTAAARHGRSVGEYYNRMLTGYQEALTAIAGQFPGKTVELTGFAWHQGWNDRVNQAYNDEYEANLVDFINDVRGDLNAPDLPFVIATTGMHGWSETHPRALSLMEAQLAMADTAKYPEFQGNVDVVETRGFYLDPTVSPADQGYHWNRNAKTMYEIGDGMGDAMVDILPIPEPASLMTSMLGLTMIAARRRQAD